MNAPLEHLEAELHAKIALARHWHLREIALSDATALAVQEKAAVDERIDALMKLIEEIKNAPPKDKPWFHRMPGK